MVLGGWRWMGGCGPKKWCLILGAMASFETGVQASPPLGRLPECPVLLFSLASCIQRTEGWGMGGSFREEVYWSWTLKMSPGGPGRKAGGGVPGRGNRTGRRNSMSQDQDRKGRAHHPVPQGPGQAPLSSQIHLPGWTSFVPDLALPPVPVAPLPLGSHFPSPVLALG